MGDRDERGRDRRHSPAPAGVPVDGPRSPQRDRARGAIRASEGLDRRRPRHGGTPRDLTPGRRGRAKICPRAVSISSHQLRSATAKARFGNARFSSTTASRCLESWPSGTSRRPRPSALPQRDSASFFSTQAPSITSARTACTWRWPAPRGARTRGSADGYRRNWRQPSAPGSGRERRLLAPRARRCGRSGRVPAPTTGRRPVPARGAVRRRVPRVQGGAGRVASRGDLADQPADLFLEEGHVLDYPAHKVVEEANRYAESLFRAASWGKLLRGQGRPRVVAEVIARHGVALVARRYRDAARFVNRPLPDDLGGTIFRASPAEGSPCTSCLPPATRASTSCAFKAEARFHP